MKFLKKSPKFVAQRSEIKKTKCSAVFEENFSIFFFYLTKKKLFFV